MSRAYVDLGGRPDPLPNTAKGHTDAPNSPASNYEGAGGFSRVRKVRRMRYRSAAVCHAALAAELKAQGRWTDKMGRR